MRFFFAIGVSSKPLTPCAAYVVVPKSITDHPPQRLNKSVVERANDFGISNEAHRLVINPKQTKPGLPAFILLHSLDAAEEAATIDRHPYRTLSYPW